MEQEAGAGRKEGEGGRKGKEEKEKGKEKKKRGAPAEFAATVDHAGRSATRGARKKRDGAVIELGCRYGENRREGFREFRILEKI